MATTTMPRNRVPFTTTCLSPYRTTCLSPYPRRARDGMPYRPRNGARGRAGCLARAVNNVSVPISVSADNEPVILYAFFCRPFFCQLVSAAYASVT